jgi:DNA-binding NarL/FixJ family response regulator
MAKQPLSVLVVAAYPAVRAGLRAMLDARDGIDVVGEATPASLSGPGWVGAVDVVVIDLDDDAEAVLPALEDATAPAPAVLIGIDPADFPLPADGSDVPRGYLLRTAGADELAAAVWAVARGLIVMDQAVARAAGANRPAPVRAAGEPAVESLTEREREVLRLLADGLPNKGIALRLGISEHTVKFHVGAILAKLGAAGRTDAVMLAARRGLLPL